MFGNGHVSSYHSLFEVGSQYFNLATIGENRQLELTDEPVELEI